MEYLTGLDELTVLDPSGAEHAVPSLWAQQPIVLAMMRHFG